MILEIHVTQNINFALIFHAFSNRLPLCFHICWSNMPRQWHTTTRIICRECHVGGLPQLSTRSIDDINILVLPCSDRVPTASWSRFQFSHVMSQVAGLILVKVNPPWRNGFSLFQVKLRKHITSYHGYKSLIRVTTEGSNGYLVGPFYLFDQNDYCEVTARP